ncbi:LAMI_0D03026g1_1 [Lachancea mirantina]|uniref:Nucleoporin NSP1 n=1 Tax=Lachancea mirantina TaxID=1230905 RepID=A0A1G4J9H7_9SACH|nr:LAMI_0D03026g1_1 [Lachancea mirantina]
MNFGNSQASGASPFGSLNASTGSNDAPKASPFGAFGSAAGNIATNGTQNSSSMGSTLFGSESSTPAFGAGSAKPATSLFGNTGISQPPGQMQTGSANSQQKPAGLTFGFNNKPTETESNKGTSPFSFGAPKLNTGTNDAAAKSAAPTGFSFGSNGTQNSTETAKPPLSFGGANNAKPGQLLGSQSSTGTSSTKPAFGQGLSTGLSAGSLSTASNTTENKEEKKPFSFGSAAAVQTTTGPSLNFGKAQQTTTANDTTPKPAFSFGGNTNSTQASSAAPLSAQKNAFSFGSGSTATANKKDQADNNKLSDDKPAFSFGSTKPTTNNLLSTSTESKSLSGGFGASLDKPQNDAQEGSTKPTFNFGAFGAKNDSSTASSKPKEAKTDTKPAFSFGSEKPRADTKPLFNKNSGQETKTSGSPAFVLGSMNEKDANAAKSTAEPAASTVAKTAPAFSFGQSKPQQGGEKKLDGFSFGKNETQLQTDSKPSAFSFGSKESSQSNVKPSTDETTEKKEEKKTTGFSFGSVKPPMDAASSEKLPTTSFGSQKTAVGTTSPPETGKKSNSDATSKLTVELQPETLDNKTLDDLITKWTSQLSGSSLHFEEYSQKIRDWDKILVQGGEQISELYSDTLLAEQSQNRIDQTLQYIERQQTELESFLDNYERKAETLLSDVLSSNPGSSGNSNDQKRQQAYRTAESLDDNLDSLSTNLSSLISEINDVSDIFNKATNLNVANKDENIQLIKLLNSHLDALKTLDTSSEALERKIKTVSK